MKGDITQMTTDELQELERIRAERNRKPRPRAVRTEVYSRIVGYYRPVQSWNNGKREEFGDRKYIEMPEMS